MRPTKRPARAKPKRRKSTEPGVDYGPRALRRLAWLMENAESEQAQVAAAKELLDRLHGAADADEGMERVVARLRELRPAPAGQRDAK